MGKIILKKIVDGAITTLYLLAVAGLAVIAMYLGLKVQ